MKSIILIALCIVAVFAQRRPGGGGLCRPNTSLGVTQAMCDAMRTCMDATFPKPAAGTVLTDAQRAAQKAAKTQAETTCAAQAGISTTALATLRAQHPGPRPAAGTGTATGRK